MGCAPSSGMGERFHNSVVPLSMYPVYDAWGGPEEVLFADYEPYFPIRDPERSRLLVGEDPPPYTEVAMEGHVSLMRGGCTAKMEDTLYTSVGSEGSTFPLDDSFLSSAIPANHDELRRMNSLPLDMRGAERSASTMELMSEQQNSSFVSAGEGSHSLGSSSMTMQDAARHQPVSAFPPRPSTLPRSMSLGYTPSYWQMEAPSALQMTRRESYPGVLSLPVHPVAGELVQPGRYPHANPTVSMGFPPRPSTVSPHQSSYLRPLHPVHTLAPLNPTYPPPHTIALGPNEAGPPGQGHPHPARLPPIGQQVLQLPQQQHQQESQDLGKKLRKRRRRKRGHTWHGEGLPRPVAPVESVDA